MKILKICMAIILLTTVILFILIFYYDTNKNLGAGFVYDSEHKHILGKIDIPPKVKSFDYDDKFIIVKQIPTEFHNSIYDKMEYNYQFGKNYTYFWIIFKDEQRVLGPLDSTNFKELKNKFNIPINLKLE